MTHGYKALNQGTYYTYFIPQLSEYGITYQRINTSNLYVQSSSTAHTEALNALKRGNWLIACMDVENWTSSGYFILLYQYDNGYVCINDPASTSAARTKNTWDLFAKQVKCLWTVTVPIGPDMPIISSSVNNQLETSIEMLGKISTTSSSLNVRSAPNTFSTKIGSYAKGSLVQLISKTSTNWYRTDKGYISGDYVIAAKGKVFNCTKLNMRKEPKEETNNVVSALNVNDEVYLLKIADNGWYKIKTKNKLVGYVSNKYITIL